MRTQTITEVMILKYGPFLFTLLAAGSASAERPKAERPRVAVLEGYVAHGINTYNGAAIADYANASPTIPWLNPVEPIREIGVFEPGAADAGIIRSDTDSDRLVATTRSFFDFFHPDGPIDESLVNRPLDEVGSNYFGFVAVDDRVRPSPFPEPGALPSIHRAKEVIASPTVGQWNAISGRITVKTRRDGTSVVLVTIRNGFANGVYTLWDVGALNPMTPAEEGYGIPLGGIPNVLVTDNDGCAFKRVELPYSLVRKCEPGAPSCTSYVSAFYHWDGQVYGASPAATFANAPTGMYAGNQIVFPASGALLQAPSTRFGRPRAHGCFGRGAKRGGHSKAWPQDVDGSR